MTEDYVVPLDRLPRSDVERAGGKAANLGELVRGGFPVPHGFVVTTAAYRPPDLSGFGVAAGGSTGEAAGEAIRAAIVEAAVPEDVSEAVRAAYRDLGGGAVAVRSSATTEDLPDATFAGQQDTFLHVIGEQNLLDAVRRCWASLWTARAIDYRDSRGIDHGRARIAVVVQRMVRAEFAGVAFTSDPVTGDRHTLIIDANPGLGEAVVSGLVTPEHIVVDKRRSRVVGRSAGRAEVLVRPRAEGGTEQVAERPAESALPTPAVWRLVRIAADVERHFGRPQDIEWAWAEGTAYVLQTRPITALPEQPVEPGRIQRLTAGILAEIVPIRPYPIDITAWAAPLVGSIEKLMRATGFTGPPLDRMFVEEGGVVARVEPTLPGLNWRALTAPVRLVRAARRYDPGRWRSDPLVDAMQRRARQLRGRDIGGATWPELLALLKEGPRIAADGVELRLRYFPRTALALAGLYAALTVLHRRRLMGALLSGVDTFTTDANRALEDMAAIVRADPGLSEAFARHRPDELFALLRPSAPSFLADFDAFLDRYGHRDTTTPLLLTQPAWQDEPEVVLSILKGLADQPPPPAGPHPSEQAEQALFAHPLLRRGPASLGTAVRTLLRQARWFQQVRDDTRFLLVLPLPTMRQALLEMGRRLVDAGVLDTAEDVFHLRLNELDFSATWPPAPELRADLRERATQRKAQRAGLAGTPLVTAYPVSEPSGDVVLRGTPGSAGLRDGPVRVIHGAEDFANLRNGDVLVAAYTSPAWTPLFRRAAAVVVDTGGVASHAAIVAREYGIPAVMATVHATTRLTDGQRVRVDGDAGVVLRLSGAEAG
ncbi:PEP/pyruvate-binding domain-containing protein [Streptomyces sp. NPDC048483]|uniref:PEP/pyruvate-binding domain-containing protein n=1 Tax=Streptomyces sp. NPDC048483 TaxID=3154927 RepID=UPI003424CF2F